MNEYDKLIICNGCSPEWLTSALPTWLLSWFLNFVNGAFKPACDDHDVAYYKGFNDQLKNRADKVFYRRMKRIIKKRVKWRYRWLHYIKAYIFYKMVQKVGFTAFTYADKERILPSYLPNLDTKIRNNRIQCVWLFNRWWLRSEAIKKGFIGG